MSLPARDFFRTRDLDRARAAAKARRTELDTFFRHHLADVKQRLTKACQPFDAQRRQWHKKQVQAIQDRDQDQQPFRPSGAKRRRQLWQIEGDGCGQ